MSQRRHHHRHRQCRPAPIAGSNGALSSVPAHELGKIAITAACQRANVKPSGSERSDHGAGC